MEMQRAGRYVRFCLDDVLKGLRFHFRELGIAAVLEEGLRELIERNMGPEPVYVGTADWRNCSGDYELAAALLEIARVSPEQLRGHSQGRKLLRLKPAASAPAR